jgi:hypothetical protein
LHPKFSECDSIPDYTLRLRTINKPKSPEDWTGSKKVLKCLLLFQFGTKVILYGSSVRHFDRSYSGRIDRACLLFSFVLLGVFAIANQLTLSRTYPRLRSRTLFMTANILTVALGAFDLFVRRQALAPVAIDVIVSSLGLCYGAFRIQKEWQRVGRNGILPYPNSVPVLASGILAFL